MTPEEFAARVKQKYPYLAGVATDRIVSIMLNRYPEYRAAIDLETASPKLRQQLTMQARPSLMEHDALQAAYAKARQGIQAVTSKNPTDAPHVLRGPAAAQVSDATMALLRQIFRVAVHPYDVSKQSAENRFTPMGGDWPIKDYGYKDPVPKVPENWWRIK
jgi:hypothetical protein